jgi:hypothetical protein
MHQFSVQGVVRCGQIVLDIPLDLPDGTIVTVTEGAPRPTAEEQWKLQLLTNLNRLDLIDDPDWKAKAEPDRIAAMEQLTLEAARVRASRSEVSEPEVHEQTANRS